MFGTSRIQIRKIEAEYLNLKRTNNVWWFTWWKFVWWNIW
jgi:hypothetical protein